MAENAVHGNGFFKRVKTFIEKELKLFGRCVGSSSPDRSSAAVLFLVMFAASLTCTSSRYLMESQPGRFPNYVVPWLIIGFEVVATVSLVLMWCYARNRRPDDDTSLQPWHRFLRRNIKLFGIVPFFFAIFVFDVFRLIANLTCIDAWVACSRSSMIQVEHITDLMYPVARTVYLCVELLVCIKFNAADFFQNTLVLVGLAIVQATNLSSWLDALVDESHVFLSERNWTFEISSCFNETGVNVSVHFVQCFKRETGEYKLLESASPYLFPFIMEFLMLVIECVADWFFSDAARHDATHQPPSQTNGVEHALTSPVANNGSGDTEPVRTTSYGSMQVEQQPQQGADATVSRASSSDSVLSDARSRPSESTPLISGFVDVPVNTSRRETWWFDRCPRLFFSVIMPSIASFLLLIFGIYNFRLGQNYLNLFMCYRSGYWLALTLAALIGYAASRRFPSGPMNPNGFEYFVILSCIGPILQSIFTIVANVQTDGYVVPMGMFLTEEITNVIQICTQIVFYAYAKSTRLSTDELDVNNECQFRRRRAILMGVISYYAVCNAALWVEDSFIDTRSSVTSWQRQYFDNWPLIYNIFNPLSLMFRFNSFLLFLDVLFDKRRYR